MTVTPLHVRSGYSLLEGCVGPDRLVELAGSIGHERLALTDVNSLCGVTVFDKAARRAGIEPIIGAELRDRNQSVIALVASATGYENLCQLITRRHREDAADVPPLGGSSHIDRPVSQGYRPGLQICRPCGTGPGRSSLVTDLAELGAGLEVIVEDASLAEALLAAGVERGQLWLGIDPPVQGHSHLRRLSDCAQRTGLPLVAVGKALAPGSDDGEVVRLLTAIQLGTNYDSLTADQLPPPSAVLRSPEEIHSQLADFPQAVANNLRLTERCAAFTLLPDRPVFPDYRCPDGLSAPAYLRRLCEAGLTRRYGSQPSRQAHHRLRAELELIERLGFCEYFLVVWDIVRYARGHGAPVAGRGSGASSLAAYVLGITNVCPLTYSIPFERFLHEGRDDFPDLDIDFCWRIRDDVIDYAFRRWGDDHVAMISTHNTFQARSAARETAKAFGLSNDQISRLAGETPTGRGGTIAGLDERTTRKISRLSRRIVGLPHLLSVHPGGIVIARKPIDRYVPIQRAAKGVMITQYDKDGVEDMRLVKIDLLGNRNLSTVHSTCEAIRRRGVQVDVESIPPDDPAAAELLRTGRTVGCNQLESPAMRHLLVNLQPKNVRDVMKALALIRPGAAKIGGKEAFIRRHRGLDAVIPGRPDVDAILSDTYGIMLYEDDTMLVAWALLGGSLSEADRCRKAIQKCSDDRRREQLSREFLTRCRANGVDGDYAKAMWVQMAKFNAYSFCRAHAASYAQLAFTGAYLKAHYPLEYWTAALNNNQGMWHPRVYVEQAKRAGIRFLLPDANRSGEEFLIEGDAIRVGLNFIAGLGPGGIEGVLSARRSRPFANLSDCLARTGLSAEQARAMILCGAFDWAGRKRPELMIELDLAVAARGQLTGSAATLLAASPTVPTLSEGYSDERKYADERRILGVSVRRHVMALFRASLRDKTDTDSRRLAERIGRQVRIAGLLEAYRTTRTRRGEVMSFLTLEDEWGLFEVTVFPDARRRARVNFNRYGPYVAAGRVEEQYDCITVTANNIFIHALPTCRPAQAGECLPSRAGIAYGAGNKRLHNRGGRARLERQEDRHGGV